MSTAEYREKVYDHTVAQISNKTRFSCGAITHWIRTGILPAESDGVRWLVNEEDALRVAATKRTRRKFVVHRHASSP